MTTSNVGAIYPLTPTQEGMLYHALEHVGAGVYLGQMQIGLQGPLDLAQLQNAWEAVIARHDALRTLFTWEKRQRPLQVVRHQVAAPWQVEDWRHLGPAEQGAQLEAFLAADRARDFDLSRAPLMRFALFRLGDETHRLVWTAHHLILDGWSTGLMARDVFATLAGEPALAATASFQEHVSWLAEQDLGRAERYWRETLSGLSGPTPLDLGPAAQAGSLPTGGRHLRHESRLTAEQSAALARFAQSQRVTLNTLFQAAWALVLSSYSQRDDVVFGVTLSGRPYSLPDIERRVGMFITTLPLRVPITAEQPIGDWLRDLQARALHLTEMDYSPPAKIRGWSGLTGAQALFDTLVVFENYPAAGGLAASEGGLTVTDLHLADQSHYPLAVLIEPGAEIGVTMIADLTRVPGSAIPALSDQLITALEALARDAGQPVRAVSLLSEQARSRLRALGTGPRLEPPADDVIQRLIERWATETPDAPAVISAQETLTHSELNRRADRLAHRLRTAGVRPGACVGLHVERSPELLVGLLGILKAGGAYVPLDPAYPRDRLAYMLAEVAAPVALTGKGLPPLEGFAGLVLDVADDGESTDASPVANGATGDDLAYVIFTSGSTGLPKGVPVRHRHLVGSTAARFSVYPARAERYLLLSSFSFDSSVPGLFWPLCQGGAVCLPAQREEQDALAILGLIERWAVTHTLCLPSLYGLLLEFAAPQQLASLRAVIVAGEACPPDLPQRHAQAAPAATLYNEYGPTEATVWASVAELRPGHAGRVSIGVPIPNTTLLVLDERRGLAPLGVPGQLVIAGAGVVDGYLNRPELTAERFIEIADPWALDTDAPPLRVYATGDLARWTGDGELDFLGRADQQVKIRGHRIELDEIEAALRALPGVRDAAVIARTAARLVDAAGVEALAAGLAALDDDAAEALLNEIENTGDEEAQARAWA